jgi:Tfp pilus assembly PilM family ATPase
LKVIAKARTELNPTTLHEGHVIDETAFRRALNSVRAQAGFSERDTIHVTLSISEQLVFPFSIIQPAHTTPQQLTSLIIEEAQKKIPFDPQFQKIFIIKETLTQPVLFAYAIDKRIIESYERILGSVRIKIEHIEPDSIALMRYILPDVALNQQLTLIDIGTDITHIITVQNGYPVLSQHIPFGAETLKKTADMYGVTPKKIPQAIRAFTQDIAARIKRADEFLEQYEDSTHHSIRILGGGSLLPHLSEIIERESGSVVSPGAAAHVFNTVGLTKKELPIFAHAIGSSLRGSSQTIGRALIPLDQFMSVSKTGFHASLNTVKKRLAAGFVVIMILIVAAVVMLFVKNYGTSDISNMTNTSNENTGSALALTTFSIDLSDPSIAAAVTYITKTDEEKMTIQTTGIHTTTGFAQGTVRLFNTSSNERPLVSGTRLATNEGIIFKILESANIPAEGSQDVIVRADSEGATGNISSGIRLLVPGLNAYNQQYTYGITQENFTGGIATVHVVAAYDVEQAQKTLTDLLLSRSKKEFAELQSDTKNIVTLDSQNVITVKADPAIDAESQTVTVTVSATASALSIQNDILARIAEQHLENMGTLQQLDITNAMYNETTKTGTATVAVRYTR